MKIILSLILAAMLFTGLATNGAAEEITLKASGEGQWTIYDSEGQDIGTVGRVGNQSPEFIAEGYSILPKGGQYIGVIRSDGVLQVHGRHPVITPSEARLYLDVLEALQKIK